jgi:hypothetical protein
VNVAFAVAVTLAPVAVTLALMFALTNGIPDAVHGRRRESEVMACPPDAALAALAALLAAAMHDLTLPALLPHRRALLPHRRLRRRSRRAGALLDRHGALIAACAAATRATGTRNGEQLT